MRIRVWTVGIFVVVGFLIFAAVLFLIGNRHKVFASHYDVYTEFSDLSGIEKGATVRVSGMDAGQVTDIKIPQDPHSRFRLKLELEQKVNAMVRDDSVASIKTEGVVGNKFIFIEKGKEDSAEAKSGSTLPSKEPVELGEMLEKGSKMLNEVQGTIKDVRGRVDLALNTITKTVGHADDVIVGVKGNVIKISKNSKQITANIDQLVRGVQRGEGPIGVIMKDEKTANQLRATVNNARLASNDLKNTSAKIDNVVTDFQTRNLVSKADVTLENVRNLSKQLDDTLSAALANDRIGETAAANIRNTLSNLNQSTANLADDTEALKHNFFFRGFFKDRGYYSLQDIGATKYRGNSKLAEQIQTRKWLSAAELFETDGDGQERLSPGGQYLLDQTVTRFIGSLPNHPMIVEGYSTADTADKQYLQARERSVLVRHYLEQHFHVSHKHIGTVSLSSKPPSDAGIDSWNGVSLVVLDQ